MTKKEKKLNLSITNPRVFDAVKLLCALLIALVITFLVLCLISKNPVKAFFTILTGPLSKRRYFGAVIESFIPYAFAGLAAGILSILFDVMFIIATIGIILSIIGLKKNIDRKDSMDFKLALGGLVVCVISYLYRIIPMFIH